jgi:hypothetical protein
MKSSIFFNALFSAHVFILKTFQQPELSFERKRQKLLAGTWQHLVLENMMTNAHRSVLIYFLWFGGQVKVLTYGGSMVDRKIQM